MQTLFIAVIVVVILFWAGSRILDAVGEGMHKRELGAARKLLDRHLNFQVATATYEQVLQVIGATVAGMDNFQCERTSGGLKLSFDPGIVLHMSDGSSANHASFSSEVVLGQEANGVRGTYRAVDFSGEFVVPLERMKELEAAIQAGIAQAFPGAQFQVDQRLPG